MGETCQTRGLPDAARRRSARQLVDRLSLIRFTRDVVRDISGATAVEYGLIVACIFLAIIGGLSLFATNANSMYTTISSTVGAAIR